MKFFLLTSASLLIGLASFSQTITAPTGQSLLITNSVDVTGGGLNILTDNDYKIGGRKILSNKGTSNIFIGEDAGLVNASGSQNFFAGPSSGKSNTGGIQNMFIGLNSGFSNTTGNYNFFGGLNSGYSNVTGEFNLFLGAYSGYSNTIGESNVFIGTDAGHYNTSGKRNIFIGKNSGYSNTVGEENSFSGLNSGFNNTSGNYNFFAGSYSGFKNTSGSLNIFVGAYAGYDNLSGSNNLFNGPDAGRYNSTGNRNVFLGTGAGYSNTNGSDNTYVGYSAGSSGTFTNATGIGANATATASNTVVLGNAATTITGSGLADGNSGLKFAKLTSISAPTPTSGSNKVLSVDGTGNVILVALAGGNTTTGTNPVAESTWKNEDGYLYNNSTNGVVIKGTGMDGNALIVKGGVLSKEVNVKVEGAESWPDYVFKPTYKRMSLEEVEKFIAINGHLPNVASATEMAATGNNLNKTDIKLLEKVEELTLYLLDMKKANDAQSAEIQALKKQMSKLRKK